MINELDNIYSFIDIDTATVKSAIESNTKIMCDRADELGDYARTVKDRSEELREVSTKYEEILITIESLTDQIASIDYDAESAITDTNSIEIDG
tara:strand:+ start:614 stop:895 length:282 start_codon:yes stop_codon:yes gene_type:complete